MFEATSCFKFIRQNISTFVKMFKRVENKQTQPMLLPLNLQVPSWSLISDVNNQDTWIVLFWPSTSCFLKPFGT